MRFNFYRKVLLFVSFLYSFSIFAQELRFEKKRNGIVLLENDSPRYFYQSTELDTINTFSRSNYTKIVLYCRI